jgi:hypothetical protein
MSAFDKLCWFAEKFPSDVGPLAQILRQAHLFRFPHVPHESLPKSYTREELDFQREFFVLPFRTIAIEDPTSCVILWDDKPDQTGLTTKRWFVELAPLSMTNARSWNDADREAEMRAALPAHVRARLETAFNFSFGQIEVLQVAVKEETNDSWQFQMGGQLVTYHMLNEEGPMPEGFELLRDSAYGVTSTALRNAMTALEELMVFNRPDRFIVRERPARVRPADGPKIPRSHERDSYTILHPQEARSKLGLAEPSRGGAKFVGERRRHVRRYPDDPARWPKAHGKTIVIPATWVGPHEAQVGRRHFSIMLDL